MSHYLKSELYDLIKKDERIFDFIQEGSLDGIWYWDLEHPENEWMSPKFWQVLGYDPQEMPHKADAWQSIINQDDLKLAIDNFQKHVADPKHPYDQQVRYTHKNGSTVWVRCRGMAIRDEHGKAIRMLGAHHDITAQKNAQLQLEEEKHKVAESEKKFKFIAKNTSDLVLYHHTNGDFELISPNVLELTGYTAEEYAEFSPFENVLPKDRNLLKENLQKIQQGHDLVISEYRIYKKSGDIIWLQSRSRAIRDANGTLQSIISSTNDITDRKLSEIALQESEKSFRLLFEQSAVGIAKVSVDGKFMQVNQRFCDVVGYSDDELLGMDFIQITHPDDLFLDQECIAKVVNNEIDEFTIEKRYLHKNGSVVWIELFSTVVRDEAGAVKYAIATIVDITQQKLARKAIEQSEARYKQLVETASDAIYLMDEKGTIIDTNKHAMQMLHKKRSELVGQPIDTVDPNFPVNQFIEFWKNTPYEEQRIFETTHITKSGELVPIEISGKKFKIDDNDYYFGIARDISTRKKAEQELRKQRDLFELVINSVPARIFWKDLNSVYMGCNKNFCVDAGKKSIVEVIGQTDDVMVWKDDADKYRDDDRQIIQSGQPKLRYEEAFYNTDGELIVWRTNKIPLRNVDGEIIGIVATSENITEEKKAADKLVESEDKFRGIFHYANVGIAIADKDGNQLDSNPEFLEMLGYSRDEFIGSNFSEFSNPEDLKKELLLLDRVRTGEIDNYRIEKRLKRKDGSYIWGDLSLTARRNATGDISMFIAMVSDITEKRKATKAVNAFFDQPINVHLIASFKGEILRVNSGWHKILGYTNDEVIGTDFFDLLHPQDLQATQNEMQALAAGKTTVYFENRYRHKNGKYVTLAWSAVADLSEELVYGVAKDMSAEKAYHQALIQSEKQYKALSENAKHIIITHNFDGKITYANAFALQFIGLSLEQALERNITEFIKQPKEQRELEKRIQSLMAGDYKSNTYNVIVRLPNGENRTLEVLSSPILRDDKVDTILITAYDITFRKEAEQKILQQNQEYEAINEELLHTNERFNLAMEATSDGLFDWNLSTNEIYYSPRWKDILGYKDDELPNDFSVWEELTDGNDVKRSLGLLDKLVKGKTDKFDIEFKMKHKLGHWVDIHSRANIFLDKNGKAQRVVGTHTDITERKNNVKQLLEAKTRAEDSEQKFTAFMNSLPGFAFIKNEELDILYVNQKMKKELKADKWIGKNTKDVISPHDLEKVVVSDFNALNKGHSKIEEVIQTTRGETRNFITHKFRVDSAARTLLGGISLDVTEQKVLENKLIQSQKMEAIGTLAGGIAHDFNNILSSIIGFTELALEDAEPASTQEDSLQEVYRAGKRAKDLVWQILTFARQTNDPTKPIQPSTIAKEALKFIRSSLPATIEIRQRIDSESLIIGNPTQIHQIIMNLCTNAAHAMDESGGTLEVIIKDVSRDELPAKIREDFPKGEYIETSVADTGSGIPADIIGSIFQPYFTTKSTGKGTGMGLAVVQGIVEKSGGKITVESELGKGTIFRVFLPITKKRSLERSYVQEKLPTGTESILFIDDEAAITKIAAANLEGLGYSVQTSTSSLEALDKFRQSPDKYDLIITDMTMPQMTGDELAIAVMKIRQDIPIILCTGYSNKITQESAALMGIKAFAFKPIVKAELVKTVRRVLDESAKQ